MIRKENIADSLFTALAGLIILGVVGGGAYFYLELDKERDSLRAKVSDLVVKLALYESDLSITSSDKERLQLELEKEKNNLERLGDKIGSISSTVGTLEKLRELDLQLLQKYSKVYFLNEHYLPTGLADIDKDFLFNPEKSISIHEEVEDPLEDLLSEAADDSIDLKVLSGYRSFIAQSGLKATYRTKYGVGANTFSADQGFSEHQLGTTVDFTTTKVGASLVGFDKTAAYEWLLVNAHRFGFVLSYPSGNKYYVFEPWHWRFVGKDLAKELYKTKRSFYELDQREINEYLISIFD